MRTLSRLSCILTLFVGTVFTQEPKFYRVELTASDSIPTVELHLRPEIIEAMRNAWLSASLGNSPNEAGFYYNGTINPVAHTNQNGKLAFNIPPRTTAVLHTHPQGHDLMSQQDIDVANQNHIDMYVISRSGLYHYRPGMKGPEMVQAGTDYLTKNKGNK